MVSGLNIDFLLFLLVIDSLRLKPSYSCISEGPSVVFKHLQIVYSPTLKNLSIKFDNQRTSILASLFYGVYFIIKNVMLNW